MKNFKKPQLYLTFILILAAVFRLIGLAVSPPSLFGDELDLGYQAYSVFKTGKDYQGNFLPFNFHSMAEWRTPLYIYSSVPFVAIFGITPLGVRLPAALFGILVVYLTFLLVKQIVNRSLNSINYFWLPYIAAALIAINPWALQYSRAGFEVTEMLAFILLGIYLFIKSFAENKYLWVSASFLILSMWVYSTAKLFVPAFILLLTVIFRNEILRIRKNELIKAFLVFLILGVPLMYGTIFKGGTQRIADISIFRSPNMEQLVGDKRTQDLNTGGNSFVSRVVNNKYTFYGNLFITNYLKPFSNEFLFINGDHNLRQSVGKGMFYWFEFIFLAAGIAYFFLDKNLNTKIKYSLLAWLILAPIPSALTEGGGTHATRLILLLPPLIFLISFGIIGLSGSLKGNFAKITYVLITSSYLIFFAFYLHRYYYSYKLESAKWWHYGWGQAINEIKRIDKDYDKVYISMSGEPAWIFFAGHYMYNPVNWQQEFPVGRNVNEKGFGSVSHTGKYYFGSPEQSIQIYGLGEHLNKRSLYLANAKEHGENLIISPEKSPPGLKLLKSIAYPSGEPAFYIFTGTKE